MSYIYRLVVLLFLATLISCHQFTYTPKSKKSKRREKPSAAVMDRIVDFRIEHRSWPVSKEDFVSKGVKYYEVLKDFPYSGIEFKVTDTNRMTFYFYDHIKDRRQFDTEKIDLNNYHGHVKFYKEDGKFIWKIKMK